MELGNQQKQVFDDLKKWINDNYRLKSLSYKVLFGYAGTGKTTISTLLRQEFSNLKFSFLAFTGKASSVLRKTLSDFKLNNPSVKTALTEELFSKYRKNYNVISPCCFCHLYCINKFISGELYLRA